MPRRSSASSGFTSGEYTDGCRRQTGNQCGFLQIELIRCLGEIHPGRIGQPIGTGTEIHVVQILLENLLLAELAFKFVGECGFLELAGDRAVLAEKHRSRQLLGDRAGAFPDGPRAYVANQCPADSPDINAVVVVEASVFRCNKGLLRQQRHLTRLDFFSGCRSQLLDHLSVAGQQCGCAGSVETVDATCIREGGIEAFQESRLSQSDSTADQDG